MTDGYATVSPPESTAGGDYFYAFLNRTIALLGKNAVDALRVKTVAIAGCGGVGGAAAITLARLGVGGFVLADPGNFDEPDINRQWGASSATLGLNKAEVYARLLQEINPDVRIRCFTEGVTDSNITDFLNATDILIDCLDVAVDIDTRTAVFRQARQQGIYSITAPVLGFGTVMIVAAPDGMPMDLIIAGNVSDASQRAQLPQGLYDVFVPEHLRSSERLLARQKVPSASISVVFATSLVCTETTLLLLGPTVPGWRAPVCLPYVLTAEPLLHHYAIQHIRDLNRRKIATVTDGSCQQEAIPVKSSSDQRERQLRTAGYNLMLLEPAQVDIDLHTDSWSEIHGEPRFVMDSAGISGNAQDILHARYGYNYIQPVPRGRYAEAVLTAALPLRGGEVITNGLFPTTRFHLQSQGGTVVALPVAEAYDLSSSFPFKGNLDLAALEAHLSAGNVRAVYVELCNNALGGHPVSLQNLRDSYRLASDAGIPLILDATRAYENALLLRERDPACADSNLAALVREICACSHAAAASLSKDFCTPAGGFVAVNEHALFQRVRDLVLLAYGETLSACEEKRLASALQNDPETQAGAQGRTGQVKTLWRQLKALSVPLVQPVCGHALYIDISNCLPHFTEAEFPIQAFANALFAAGGIRTAPNLETPEQKARSIRLLRLAVPINLYSDEQLQAVPAAFKLVMRQLDKIRPLMLTSEPRSMLEQVTALYRPTAHRDQQPRC